MEGVAIDVVKGPLPWLKHPDLLRLGPLNNPARPKRCLVGVATQSFGRAMAEALSLTGVERAWVVNGSTDGSESGGLDEVSPM